MDASDDEGIEMTSESLVQHFLQTHHSALFARGLHLSTDALEDHDPPPFFRDMLAQPQLQRRDLAYLLLLSLESQHFQHVLNAVQPLRSFDLVGLLPTELARLILIQLDPPTLLLCERVSKSWRARATDSLVWRHMYQEAGFELDKEAANWWCGYGNNSPGSEEQNGLFLDEGLVDSDPHQHPQRLAGWMPPPKSLHLASVSSLHQAEDGRPQINYKHLYRIQVAAARNIRNGIFSVHEIATPHIAHPADEPPMYPDPAPGVASMHDSVYCFQAVGNRLIAGGRNADGSPPDVLEYDLATGQIMQIFTGHQTSVLTLQFEAGLTNALITGARDGSLIIWDLDTAAPRAEIQAHQKSLLNLNFDSKEGLLVTGSKGLLPLCETALKC